MLLKGVYHEIFDRHFFHDSNPSGPQISRLKCFQILFRFRRDSSIRSQSFLRGVKVKIFTCHWLLLKWQSGEILTEVNISMIKERIWSWFTIRRHFCDQKSQRNWNLIRKNFNLFIRGPDGNESWKKWSLKISCHTPLKWNSAKSNFWGWKSPSWSGPYTDFCPHWSALELTGCVLSGDFKIILGLASLFTVGSPDIRHQIVAVNTQSSCHLSQHLSPPLLLNLPL